MIDEEYNQATNYEMLIRNAFNCQKGSRNGADLSYMKNAMTMERGETFAKQNGSYEKQFDKVKNYISKALIKLSKTKPYSQNKQHFQSLENSLENSHSTKDLMYVVNNALDRVIELRK